jgi:hypothetical protein
VERATADPGITYTLMASDSLSDTFSASTDAFFVGEEISGDYKSVTNRIPTDGKNTEFLRMDVEEN